MMGNQSKMQGEKAIPAGYKLTEVGVIPGDWEVASLQDISSKITDGTHDTPKPAREGIPFLTAIHVKDGRIDFDSCYFLPEKIHNEIYCRCNPEFGDILMVNIGSGTATTAVVNVSYEFSLKNVALIKPRNTFSGFYINYALSFSKAKIIETISTGGAQPFLSLSQISQLRVAKPSFEEQTAIANVLSDTDALITELEQLITKKEAIRTAIMQQLLTGRTRLPQFSKNPDGTIKGYKSSELGHIPEDWEVVKLKDVCFFENGDRSSNYPTPDSFVESGIPFINAGHIGEGIINQRGMNFITYKAFEKLGGGKVKPNDILFCLRGSLGKFGIVPDNFGIGAIASSLVIIRTKQQVLLLDYFASGYLKSSICENMIELWAGGAAQPNLGARELGNFLLPLPSVSEQRSIATILSDMDAELTTLKRKLAKIHDIKQGMMQQLLTGRIRLPLEQQP
ncbi:restriction endonuclease subunit S [Citrobacter sp.]|uniref:restriction endonuclease subunit S n=1 Tax=Citrobacter sp. TaxID=1896336 RepID=UPI002FC85C35